MMEDESRGKRVAIVGCGVAGLTAIKACLEEGLQPHCLEMSDQLGGVWYAPDTPKPGDGPQMYDNLIMNTSKVMTNFSDFPCPASYPPYLPHRLYLEYLQNYAEHFQLLKYVSFNTKVVAVNKSEDYSLTGCWVVTTRRMEDGEESGERTSQVYDAVILCQGVYNTPYIPPIPGLADSYKGRVTHANRYKTPYPFKDKTVVVVGGAFSAGDVATDIAPLAKQVYLSVHHGGYVLPRIYKGLTPLDFCLNRLVVNYAPGWVMQRMLVGVASQWLNPVTSGLQPEASTPFTRVSIMINDQLPFRVWTGQVKVVSQIVKVEETGDLQLEDGQVLSKVDDIIFATGYNCDFTVIDPSMLTSDPKSGKLELYKMVFPTALPKDTLAVVGCVRAIGPMPPILEMQARFAARVMSGRHQLPGRERRQLWVDRVNQQQLKDYGRYMYYFTPLAINDIIAAELGVKPSWWRFLLRGDVGMARAVLLGPALPFHYRLVGPHPWPGARQAIHTAITNTLLSTQHRRVGQPQGRSTVWLRRFCLLVLVPVFTAVVYCFWWNI